MIRNSPDGVRWGRRFGLAGALASAAVLVLGLTWASIALSRGNAPVAAIWPSDAVLLLLMLSRRRPQGWLFLPAGLAGGLITELASGDSALIAVLFVFANGLGIAIIYAGLGRLKTALVLRRTRHLVTFLIVTVVGATISGLIAALALALIRGAPILSTWGRWSLSDWLGYAVLTPLVLMLGRRQRGARKAPRGPGVLALGLYTLLVLGVFGQSSYPLLFLAPFGLFCVSYMLSLDGVILAVVITVVLAILFSMLGRGPSMLVHGSPGERLLVMQSFLAVITLSILPISSVMGERRRLQLSLERARDRARASANRATALSQLALMAEEIAGVGHWRRDFTTGEAVWSPQIFRILGFPLSDIPPSFEALAAAFPPEEGARLRTAFAADDLDRTPRMIEVGYVRPDGEARHLALNFAREPSRGGPGALVGLMRDVTEAKRLEADLLQARHTAETASALKSDFLANMSHELRTPLASILGFGSLLQQRLDPDSEDRLHAIRISTAAKALLTTVNDILLFSEVEAGELDIRTEAVATGRMIREAVDLFEERAVAKGLRLSLTLAGGLPAVVRVDARRVRQLLLNLIGNAVKFTDAGAVLVTASYDADQAALILEVADTGPGIAADKLHGVFDRFSQVDSSMRRAHGGAGLGLAISKGLAEAMGGRIEVASEPGRGSVFRVVLTAEAGLEPGRDADEPMARALRPAIRSVLIVDDVAANRELIRAILEPLKLTLVEAGDGTGLLAEAATRAFDLILIDVQMPHLDGAAAAIAIRDAAGPNQNALIMATSTDQAAAAMTRLKAAGFDGFIAKPFPAEVLLRLALNPPPRRPRDPPPAPGENP